MGRPLKEATNALILLHGRGGSAKDMLSLADAFCDDSFYIAAPQAPTGSWYPYSFMANEESNEPFLSSSLTMVKQLIDSIAARIPYNRIYLMGFSQGACLALESAARYAAPYKGVVAFSGGLIGPKIDESKYQGKLDGTKVFIGISEQDPHVPLKRAQESKRVLQKQGADVTLMVYPGSSHTVLPDEIQWVKEHLFP